MKALQLVSVALMAGCLAPPWSGAEGGASVPLPAAATGWFTNGVLRLRLEVAAADLAELRADPRKDVRARVAEGERIYSEVGVHLKGSTGSFRGVDDKPALTLSFDKFNPSQRFHGLSRIHLNNSVEDPSYLHEWIGGELFRAAGVPAPRVAHALVELNGRKLGLYVLKEGFATEFLALHFRKTTGNLYDTGPGHDVDEALTRDRGDGPGDLTDLKSLAEAAQEPVLAKRWQRLEQLLDLDRFLSFMAMEVMAGHRDGYCLARNNFRLYFDPETGRFVFLPHGMDNLFGRADFPVRPQMAGLVARAVMELPEGRRLYRERAGALFTNVFKAEVLIRRVDEVTASLEAALDAKAGREIQQQAKGLKERIAARAAGLARQLSLPEVRLLAFTNEIATPAGWRAMNVPDQGRLDQAPAPDGRPAFHILAGPGTAASWRSAVLLKSGRYRFEATAQTRGVKPLPYGRNHGAALRVSSGTKRPSERLAGDTGWTKLAMDFEVTATEAEVQVMCDLRASQGEAWFDADSLRLVRLP